MSNLTGNAVLAFGGGPISVFNATLAGFMEEASKHKQITGVLSAKNGIEGVLLEQFYDVGSIPQEQYDLLSKTPDAATGSCRRKISPAGSKKDEDKKRGERDIARILDVCKAHNIRYFFYYGGNDSMDTANEVLKLAKESNYEMVVMGLPKTTDNDLIKTDHTLGAGTCFKYTATNMLGLLLEARSLPTVDQWIIYNAFGRDTGWIPASASLADPEGKEPIFILTANNALDLGVIDEIVTNNPHGVMCVSEGLWVPGQNGKKSYISTGAVIDGKFVSKEELEEHGKKSGVDEQEKDLFGHQKFGSTDNFAANIIMTYIKQKHRKGARSVKPDALQRCSPIILSGTDYNEAYFVGMECIRRALDGSNGVMLTLNVTSRKPYEMEIGEAPLADIANKTKHFPDEWILKRGKISGDFREYALPLIKGEITPPYANGLPNFFSARDLQMVPKKDLPEYKL